MAFPKSEFILIAVGIVCWLTIFYILPMFPSLLKLIDSPCYINCGTDKCANLVHKSRGKMYFLDRPYDFNAACIVGFWEISHVIFHIFIGYHFGIVYSLVVGVAFELYERYSWNCESYMDILFNTMGATIGIGLHHILNHK